MSSWEYWFINVSIGLHRYTMITIFKKYLKNMTYVSMFIVVLNLQIIWFEIRLLKHIAHTEFIHSETDRFPHWSTRYRGLPNYLILIIVTCRIVVLHWQIIWFEICLLKHIAHTESIHSELDRFPHWSTRYRDLPNYLFLIIVTCRIVVLHLQIIWFEICLLKHIAQTESIHSESDRSPQWSTRYRGFTKVSFFKL